MVAKALTARCVERSGTDHHAGVRIRKGVLAQVSHTVQQPGDWPGVKTRIRTYVCSGTMELNSARGPRSRPPPTD